MFKENLPLALVTLVLAGTMIILFRELNAVKSAVATLSLPQPSCQEEPEPAQPEKKLLKKKDQVPEEITPA